ncbi:hypothetical protein [Periweissella beninensis]|uniref:Uncharacterized protein n=1 Tax=Periweissella beninensis TaxID=504936 RepID=A0ABT0VG10_9LACO|nr:hypothetical protein [Periweissella beninensis]MBM7543853.1 hypothetical protein [Periweissella beninensis]MCM2436766.1 hypothetical protein [Periweissella beninensis]MCT4395526.1 hypothetical protein [Periweissella beninensis]
MHVFLISVVAVISMIIIYHLVSHQSAQKTTGTLILAAQHPTNKAMSYAMAQLSSQFKVDPAMLNSTLIANVWGHGVMVFEFIIPEAKIDSAISTQIALENELNRYAQQEKIVGYQANSQPFKVTDFWQEQPKQGAKWHIDVAYLINEATNEYVRDITKLNNA